MPSPASSGRLGRQIRRPDELRDNVAGAPHAVRHKSCCRAIKMRATKRKLHFCSQRQVLSTHWDFLSAGRALSIEVSACLSFGTTGTRPWPRWKRLLPSSLLSWWVLALSCSYKVGGDKRVRRVLIVVPAFLMIRLLEPGFVLPAFSILLFSDAAIIAILARAIHARGNSENVTLWDIAGALTMMGCAAAIFSEPDQAPQFFGRPVEQHPDTSL